MIRSGDEPANARSPLQLRLVLAGFGLLCGVIGVVVFGLADVPVGALAFGLLGVVAAVDVAVIRRHQRQGAHYQPGPDVPPYRPAEPYRPPRQPRPATPLSTRRREYLILMTICLVLLLVAWGWVRLVSTPIAVAMSLVAMVIPPIAAVVANTGSRPGPRPPPPPSSGPPSDH